MSLYQLYCTYCGKVIVETTVDLERETRFHPMLGHKQFRREMLRACPDYKSAFSRHYGFKISWQWVDVVEEK